VKRNEHWLLLAIGVFVGRRRRGTARVGRDRNLVASNRLVEHIPRKLEPARGEADAAIRAGRRRPHPRH
jgi:hypothetical protein